MRIFLGILLCCCILGLRAQNRVLNRADSLFNEQKYTEALDVYENIYSTGQASSAMLLKMAFIQDALGNYPEALFYLDKYYTTSADREVIGKIEELVDANELRGYRYDDVYYFMALLEKYRLQAVLLLLASSLLMLAYILRKVKQNEKPLAAGVIQLMVVCLILLVNNLEPAKRGIIMNNNTLLRSGPSAGAEPVEMVSKGHKVKVLSKDHVWTKLLWDGQEVYVRNSRLRVI